MATKKTRRRRRAPATADTAKRRQSRAAAARRRPVVGFIGAGNMARSLAGGLLARGWPASRVLLADPDPGQRRLAEEALKVRTTADNDEVVARAQLLVLAVKPQVMAAVARGIAGALARHRPLVISIAAGIRLADLSRWLGTELPLVRAMPNTPALVGAGACGLYANPLADAGARAAAEAVLRAVGDAVWLDDESQLDAVTALSGSGPAYFFRFMEALERAGVEQGLAPAVARRLVLATAHGAARMALESGENPAVLRARVTSPGGTTERGLRALEEGGLPDLIRAAVRGATERARELADTFGRDA
jgi:pyrroline-5-carboxylate reductase